jgi:hypothetical protein
LPDILDGVDEGDPQSSVSIWRRAGPVGQGDVVLAPDVKIMKFIEAAADFKH